MAPRTSAPFATSGWGFSSVPLSSYLRLVARLLAITNVLLSPCARVHGTASFLPAGVLPTDAIYASQRKRGNAT